MAIPLNAVVLAAGQGKRMRSSLPKVLHPLAGRPLAAHVLSAVRSLSPWGIVVVIGHGADRVRDALSEGDVSFAVQDPPRGTGDAARVGLAALPNHGVTLVTIGDIPLVPAEALARVVAAAGEERLAVLTAKVSRSRPAWAASSATAPDACARSWKSAMPTRRSAASTRSIPA